MSPSNSPAKAGAPSVLTVDEVAAVLRLNRRTVQKLAASGQIPAVRLGALYRFDAEKIAGLFDASN